MLLILKKWGGRYAAAKLPKESSLLENATIPDRHTTHPAEQKEVIPDKSKPQNTTKQNVIQRI